MNDEVRPWGEVVFVRLSREVYDPPLAKWR